VCLWYCVVIRDWRSLWIPANVSELVLTLSSIQVSGRDTLEGTCYGERMEKILAACRDMSGEFGFDSGFGIGVVRNVFYEDRSGWIDHFLPYMDYCVYGKPRGVVWRKGKEIRLS